ncbi:TB2/DP1, HVA22 family-domain-containing protein [Hysterangium stoloniferum]|nr:TB2/DP1, HVA22 family-domain-containing protein [Hysterangium stoloniferum]
MSAAQKFQTHPTVLQAQDKASYYIKQLDKELTKYPVLNQLEQRTQVPKTYAVLGTVSLLTLLIFFNPLAAPISNLIGWGFPAYLSFKALETPQHQDDVQWLTYWIVFGFFTFLESFALRPVLYYFPFYFPFKTVFVLWLQLPAFKGAAKLYLSVLRPVLLSGSNRVATTSTTSTASADDLRSKVNEAGSL